MSKYFDGDDGYEQELMDDHAQQKTNAVEIVGGRLHASFAKGTMSVRTEFFAPLLVEFTGTFFLVFTVATVVPTQADNPPNVGLAIGIVLMVMVYMGGRLSGGHYNPAVSLACYMAGKMDSVEHLMTWSAAQIAGALVAAVTGGWITGQYVAPGPQPVLTPSGLGNSTEVQLFTLPKVFFCEFIWTFVLCVTVLNVACTLKVDGNSYYGMAIGLIVTAGAFTVGPVSGGGFNPAVSIGLIVTQSMMGEGTMSHLWVYVVAPLLGGVMSSVFFRLTDFLEFPDEAVHRD